MLKVMRVIVSLVAFLSSACALAIEFSLIGLGPDWDGGEMDAIDARFDNTSAAWSYQGVLGDTNIKYNITATYHRDSDQIYFIATDIYSAGSGSGTPSVEPDRRLYVTPRDFSQIQLVSTTKLVSQSGSELPQAMALAGDQLYVVYKDKSIDRVDRVTGASAAFATLPVTPRGVGMGYDHENERLVVTTGGLDETKTIYAVNPATGSVTTLHSEISFYCIWQGLAYLGNDQLLAVGTGSDCTELAQIDLASGAVAIRSIYSVDWGGGDIGNSYTGRNPNNPLYVDTDLVALMRISPWRPDPPVLQSATAGDGEATVTFDPPPRDGGSAITGYTLTEDSSGFTYTCSASPCAVAGLTNGQTYRFNVTATNEVGDSDPSQSAEVTLPEPDSDSDGVPFGVDNCPDVANADQADLDQDGAGDACDSDDDGDGVADTVDAYPDDPSRWAQEVPALATWTLSLVALLMLVLGLRRVSGGARGSV